MEISSQILIGWALALVAGALFGYETAKLLEDCKVPFKQMDFHCDKAIRALEQSNS